MARKGHTNNPNGRPKGSLNKKTITMRNIMYEAIKPHIGTSLSQLDELDLKDRLSIMPKFLSYITPRYHSIDAGKEMEEERLQKEDADKILGKILMKVLTEEQKKQIQLEFLNHIEKNLKK